jgi:hypothetical protein
MVILPEHFVLGFVRQVRTRSRQIRCLKRSRHREFQTRQGFLRNPEKVPFYYSGPLNTGIVAQYKNGQ